MKKQTAGVVATSLLIVVMFLAAENSIAMPSMGDQGNYVWYNGANYRVLDWFFNEGSGSIVADAAGTGNHIYLENGDAWDEGRDYEDNGALFDGVDDYAIVYDCWELDFTDNFEFSMIISIDSDAPDLMTIFDKVGYSGTTATSGYKFTIVDGKPTFTCYNGMNSFVIQGTIDYRISSLDNWFFFAVRRFQGTYSLYVNPTSSSYGLISSSFCSFNPATNNQNMLIGDANVGGIGGISSFYDGVMDSLHMWEFYPVGFNIGWGKDNIAYFGFDENTFQTSTEYVNDRLTWDHHSRGVCHGVGRSTTNSIYGGALAFAQSGLVDDYVKIGHSNTLNFNSQDEIYIEFWFKIDSVTKEQTLLSKYYHDPAPCTTGSQGYAILVESGALRFQLYKNWDDLFRTGSFIEVDPVMVIFKLTPGIKYMLGMTGQKLES